MKRTADQADDDTSRQVRFKTDVTHGNCSWSNPGSSGSNNADNPFERSMGFSSGRVRYLCRINNVI